MSLGKTASLEIRTPEGVSFTLPIASPATRAFAWMLDGFVIFGIMKAVSAALGALATATIVIPIIGDAVLDFASAVQILMGFLVSVFYGIFLEWVWRGQTVGKRVMRLQVVDERGLTLGFRQIVLRNLFRIVDILPTLFYFVGGVSCLLSARCQRLGDIAAGTLVIRRPKLEEPAIDQILGGGLNSFTAYPHLEARLRQKTSPAEAQLALDALIRRDEMDAAHRLRVFAGLAEHFRGYVDFPEEITHGLSDEQYLRNTVDTLFRKRSRTAATATAAPTAGRAEGAA